MPVSRPSTGVASSLKSPVCTTTPQGVCRAMAQASGMLWVTGIHSASISPEPIFSRLKSSTTCMCRGLQRLNSLSLPSRMPIVKAEP